MDASVTSAIPPVRQTRHSRHKVPQHLTTPPPPPSSQTNRGISSSHGLVAPASPEIISSLITSLSIISKPANSHFESPIASPLGSAPLSPSGGSFGVDYGAFSSPRISEPADENVSLDELAACPPVIRTAKPPSGFSPLTAPKSPARDTPSPVPIKSILGRSSSRPSSRGSLGSKDADTQSIGNVSIERGAVSPAPELKRRSSHDSWGKKTGRSQKGLMYMSSKERLREKEAERKRASIGAVGGDRLSIASTGGSRPDPSLAEIPISEEAHIDTSSIRDPRASIESGAASPRPIPARDSSLRKTGTNAKRSSRRSSKHKNENGASDTIQEMDEQNSGIAKSYDSSQRHPDYNKSRPHQHHQHHQNKHHQADHDEMKMTASHHSRPNGSRHPPEQRASEHRAPEQRAFSLTPMTSKTHPNIHVPTVDDDIEDGAPSPAVAQGRRRDHSLDGRRRSGRETPDPTDGKAKRSSSRLKRLSAPLSPRPDEKLAAPGGDASARASADETHVVYERPESADSVDDAVEAYLCSPRLSQKIRHPQTGRIISFSEVGDSEGSAVFCCVGMGLTRYITAFYDELALTLKLRLITPDRPGVGDSESYSDGTATPLSWPDDVYAICQALKITKFSILAHSAGAIYALATALRMPQHIRGRIHLLAPWIPPSQMSVFGSSAQTPLPPSNAIPTSQRILRALPTPFLKAANSSFMSATSSSITSSLPKTPKRKRKSNANLAKEREKDAHKNEPLPTESSGNNNKENQLNSLGLRQSPMARDQSAMEDMDRIRPHGASPTTASGPGVPNSSSTAAATHHKKSSSGASANGAHLTRESREAAAVLAAAANAIADKERQATYDTRLTHAIWELATTGANPAVDLLVCLERRHTIGFRYVDITRPVIIHHGSRDTRVPVENVRWLGKTMRRCEVRVLDGEGHGLMASAPVMGGVLMEIAKEWEDWGRLTGVSTGRGRETVREERGRRGTIGMAR